MIRRNKQFKDTTGDFLGLGNITKLQANPFDFLLGLARTQGGIAYFTFGPLGDFYLVTDPEYVREILVKQWTKTMKWERLTNASNKVAGLTSCFWKAKSGSLNVDFLRLPFISNGCKPISI